MKPEVLLLFLIVISVVKSYKILLLFPTAAPSHYILGNALARGLAEAGHNVTIVSPFKEDNPPKNGTYRDIVLTGFLEGAKKQINVKFFDMEQMNQFANLPFLNAMGTKMTKMTLEHPNFQKLIQSKDENFDAVLMEEFHNDALKALSYHYKAPLILLSTIGANGWVNPLVGNPSPPSYIPDPMLKYTSKMTFWQRIVNLAFTTLSELNRHFIFFPAQNKLMQEYFPNAPDLSELNYNASLVLLNSHESTNQPVPYVPVMIDIGGYHVKPPKELPKDLKDFMDGAKEGVVYFSMGSNIKPSQMPNETKEAILKALRKLKEKVLWKWDEDDIPGKPDNVKLSKWFPQQDILAHPNTKLFITHGGLLSATETIYHGVPVLTFPIFGDQKMNAARAEMNGFGITLPFSEITEERLTNALSKLLKDTKYRDNAKMRQRLMHDRPIKPLDLGIYWIEFVIRHKGATHLRVAALDLPWYKYFALDVILFLTLVSISAVIGLYALVIFLYTKISKKEKIKRH